MQDLLQNKVIIGLIVLALIGLIYTFATGGFSGGGDMPEFEPASVSQTPGATTPATPSNTETQGAAAPPPATTSASPGTPATAPAGSGSSSEAPSQSTTPAPGGGAEGTTQPSSIPSVSSDGGTGINEKLLAFRNLNPEDIIENKYEALEEEITKPENFAEDIGRVDPLTVVNDFIPEELRPPREGESSDEEMFAFIEEAIGYEILNSIDISVIEVIQVGSYRSVVCTINGQTMNLSEGSGVGANGVTIVASSVTRAEVVFTLSFTGAYTSVSKTKSFISGSY